MEAEQRGIPKPTHQIVVLGCGGVGKSALTMQFVKSYFHADYDPTIEDSYIKQCVVDGKVARLDNTAGQDEFKPLRDCYIRSSEGFLIVFSLTDKHSLDEAYRIHRDVMRIKEDVEIPIIFVANKTDLISQRVISRDDLSKIELTLRLTVFETSAKTRSNVDECFHELVRQMRKGYCAALKSSRPIGGACKTCKIL